MIILVSYAIRPYTVDEIEDDEIWWMSDVEHRTAPSSWVTALI